MDEFIKRVPSNKKLFLDVGCGIGDKVMQAEQMGYEAHGIEVDEQLFKIADRFMFNIKNSCINICKSWNIRS